MSFGIKLAVWGDYALFSRPEMKVEKVSYDVMTAAAARGILDAILWKPAIRWVVDKIYVYEPIRFTNIRRNEVSSKISAANVFQVINGSNKPLYINTAADRQLRSSMILKDVRYIIEAHFEMTDKAGEPDTPEKFYAMATRRMRNGNCFAMPFFGCKEFPTNFCLVEDKDFVLPSHIELKGEKDLGYMLYDMDYSDQNNITPKFVRIKMVDGVIDFSGLEVVM